MFVCLCDSESVTCYGQNLRLTAHRGLGMEIGLTTHKELQTEQAYMAYKSRLNITAEVY